VIVAGGIAALGGLPDPFMAFIPLAGAPLGLAAGFFHDRPFSLVVVTNALGGCMSLPAFFTWNLLLAIPVPALANLSVILALLAMEPAVRVGERER
jgi:ABC-type dipeptide/oligopeptide/nickel transport system permease subunit